MKSILAHAHIVSDKGENASGIFVTLQTYVLSTQRWSKIASGKSNSKGIWQVTVSRLQAGAFYAPVLRLIEAGSPAPRVLAAGGFIRYDKVKQVLTVDFGRIERLAETAYPLTASSSIFRRNKLTVAGQAKKSGVLFTSLLRGTVLTGLPTATLATNTHSSSTVSPVLANFDAEIIKFKAKEVELLSTINKKDALLVSRDGEIGNFKIRLTELEQKLSRSIILEKELTAQNKTFVGEAKRKTPIQNIAENIGTELDIANKKLRSEKRPYQFGRIELDLRGTVSSNGQSMTLASLVDLKNIGTGVMLPGIKMEILPDIVPAAEVNDVTVPNVSGLTETAVRRLLQAVDLRLELISQSISTTTTIAIGQSIKQSPVAGEKLARGESVLVVFAIAKTNSGDVS